jgi:hypothetical protein
MGELFTAPHLIFLAFISIVPIILCVIPFWQIFKKAGLGAPLSLLMIVPLVNIAMLYVLAFSTWRVAPTDGPAYRG